MHQKSPRQDTNAALWGIVATFVLTFTIWMAAPLLKDIVFLEDQGASWYFWQLPERTAMGVFSAWFFLWAPPNHHVGTYLLCSACQTHIWAQVT